MIYLLFRALFVFVSIELGTRRIVHFGVTRHPTDRWLAQQLPEATPFGASPRFLIRDNDRKQFLDHFIILSQRHLYRIVKEYARYFNYARPHPGN